MKLDLFSHLGAVCDSVSETGGERNEKERRGEEKSFSVG